MEISPEIIHEEHLRKEQRNRRTRCDRVNRWINTRLLCVLLSPGEVAHDGATFQKPEALWRHPGPSSFRLSPEDSIGKGLTSFFLGSHQTRFMCFSYPFQYNSCFLKEYKWVNLFFVQRKKTDENLQEILIKCIYSGKKMVR